MYFSEEDSQARDEESGLDEEDPDVLLNNPDEEDQRESRSGELSNQLQQEEDDAIDKADLERRRKERDLDAEDSGVGEEQGEQGKK